MKYFLAIVFMMMVGGIAHAKDTEAFGIGSTYLIQGGVIGDLAPYLWKVDGLTGEVFYCQRYSDNANCVKVPHYDSSQNQKQQVNTQ